MQIPHMYTGYREIGPFQSIMHHLCNVHHEAVCVMTTFTLHAIVVLAPLNVPDPLSLGGGGGGMNDIARCCVISIILVF